MDAPFAVTSPRTVSDPSDPRTAVVTVAVTVVVPTDLVGRTTETVVTEVDMSLVVETEVDTSLVVETEAAIAIGPLLVVATTTKSPTELSVETSLAITTHFALQQDPSRKLYEERYCANRQVAPTPIFV